MSLFLYLSGISLGRYCQSLANVGEGGGGFKPTRDALPTINHFKKLIYLQNLGWTLSTPELRRSLKIIANV